MDGVMSEGVEDMAKMSELNQASILCNLNTRYQTQDIYVSGIVQCYGEKLLHNFTLFYNILFSFPG